MSSASLLPSSPPRRALARSLPFLENRAALSLALFWLTVAVLVSARLHYGV